MGVGYSMRARNAGAAEIYIYEDVGAGFGGVSAKQFAADLKALGTVTTIDVRFNSYGGEVFDGLAIYRQLVEHDAKIIVHIDGVAASIASVIAMAGDEIRMAEAAFLMIHPPQGGVLGEAKDMREMADLLDKIAATVVTVYQDRTGADRAQIETWLEAETWFTAEEALSAGFVDAVEANMLLAAKADIAGHRETFSSHSTQAAGRRDVVASAGKALSSLRQAAALMAAPPAEAPEAVTDQARPLHQAARAQLARLQARIAARA